MGLIDTAKFIARHPLSRGRRARNLARFLSWQIGARLVPGPVAVDFVNGAKLLVRPGMTGATGNVYVGLHEFEEMAFLLHFLRPSDLFVDVGANIGSYIILASAVAGARAIGFEPGREAFAWLQRNIALNSVADRVEARQEAVGGSCDVMAFTTGKDTVNHVVIPGQKNTEATQLVSMVTLDQAIGERHPALLKIDVEGYETEVLNGATSSLQSPKLRALIVELAGAGSRYGFDESALAALLRTYGFDDCIYAPLERRLTLRPAGCVSPNRIFVRDRDAVQAQLKSASSFFVRGLEI